MKRILILVLVFIIYCGSAIAQIQNLDKMRESERNKELLRIAKETVMKYGPGYYREFKPPIIEHEQVFLKQDLTVRQAEENDSRSYYTVAYPYDRTYESLNFYAAKVYIWGDTGVVFMITFGNGFGFHDLDKPKTKSDNEEKRFMYYERIPPREKNTK